MRAHNFAISGNNLAKLYHGTCREAGMISSVQLLEGMPPNKIWEGKKVQNSARFLTTVDFERK